ncbi:MAG: DUF4249 domain-containing protein [Saprospiraceae bacterium]|nr:DUF4249 domain-containing protein [Saprospiraceae bacterium]
MRLWMLLLGVMCMAATCEKPVELDLPLPDPKLVVVSNFTTGEAMRVRVSRSRSILDDSPEDYIADAVVELFNEDDQIIEQLNLVIPQINRVSPYYTTQGAVIAPGETYKLKVRAPGFEPVMSKSAIPPRIQIQQFSVSGLTSSPGSQPGSVRYDYQVSLSFSDPGAQTNYYHLNFFQQVQDIVVEQSYLQPVVFSPFTDNNYLLAYFAGGVLIEDEPFNGKTISYTFPMSIEIYPSYQLLGKIYVELRTTSEEYYLFHNSLSRQQTNNSGTNGEPIFIYNNIENGHGIFAGYNFSLDSLNVIN